MKLLNHNLIPQARRQGGITLLELMVAMSLLTIIILGLYSMFDQTQAALIAGAEQVDVQETGRSAFGLVVDEVTEATSLDKYSATNFLVRPSTNTEMARLLLVDASVRTQELQDVFFLRRDAGYSGIGYFVDMRAEPGQPARSADTNLWRNGVGSLYRFELTANSLQMRSQTNFMLQEFLNLPFELRAQGPAHVNNIQRVADGIVHFTVRAYTNGILVGDTVNDIPLTNFALTNAVLPSHLELELGVLESKALTEARAIPSIIGVSNYLYQQAGKVQMFRRRVSVPDGNLTQ